MKIKKRRWTKEEEEYLDESWGTISKETIAIKLRRTITAINLKAQRMNLGPFLEAGDYITVNELVTRLLNGRNNGRNYFIDQLLKRGLPYKEKKVNKKSFKVINIDDFWEWSKKNRTLIGFSKLEKNILGVEPEWLKEQRKADKKMAIFKTTPWTESEDAHLLSLLKEFKYSYKEISHKIKRTEGAIKRRMIDLKYKERPLAMHKYNPWKEREVKMLKELFNKGYRADIIAMDIDRSTQAIRGKIERMIETGCLSPRSKYRKTC